MFKFIAGNSMRYSHQREIVYNSLCATDTHPTAEHIYQTVKKEMPSISISTVYRNLTQLLDEEMIQAFRVKGITHYDGNIQDHYHFICTVCNQIMDINIINKNFISDLEIKIKHKVSGYQLIVRGICNHCKTKKGD